MKLSEFDYPAENQIIAQSPSGVRDQSRLMVLHRKTGKIQHFRFENLPDLIEPESLLIVNDSKVFPARLKGVKKSGGKTEILLLREKNTCQWEALLRGRFREDQTLYFEGGLAGKLVSALGEGKVLIEFKEEGSFVRNHLLRFGEVPLPPYVRRDGGKSEAEDFANYQTVYARSYGSVAAPTAGLHFTPQLLNRLQRRGVEIAAVTLHVGWGTFKGISSENVEEHRMDSENYCVSEESAKAIRMAHSEKRKIIAVGTTSARVLESIATPERAFSSGEGSTELFIFPGYSFNIVEALITNFHLPRSTLLVLVSAFAGREQILKAYQTAILEKYRFYSYGDAMFIL
ncbi:MAG: tRNA preQ1(34) S-adenosylmethionine ribosyltransferase-isomerase QueA [Nitrospirae bacterium]|nr:tRNA preQ1(34) S-adenosylmethionine ribosyltransferase-isomerase QueA [Nitrospirota bacterium]MBI3594479.1 tRNA preQ1(34) S-adenosylmethionine ribosyltransferase-isomerase QueA [Nitrospirota bacterium]